jgi:micrococcal nuclease
MCGGRIRKLLLVAAIAAVVAAIVRALRGEPAPQFSTHPSVLGGPSPEPSTPAAPPAAAEPEAEAADAAGESGADAPPAELEAGDAPVAELPTGEQPAAELAAPPAPSGELASGDEGGALEQVEAAEGAWVDPVDGACPDGYPIKAKLKSGIFHQPGGLAYDRTKPDRCYATAEAAEADGLRAAKR